MSEELEVEEALADFKGSALHTFRIQFRIQFNSGDALLIQSSILRELNQTSIQDSREFLNWKFKKIPSSNSDFKEDFSDCEEQPGSDSSSSFLLDFQ